jgi:glycosyltransferase involved in cell wall biosynthesis
MDSVVNQTSKEIEYIVIDGNSEDGSKQLVLDYKSKVKIAISEPDKGIYEAMNKGIKLSNGEYLLFLNSGDLLIDEQVIAKVSPFLKDYDVISGNIIIEDQDGQIHKRHSKPSIDLDYFFKVSLYHQSTFVAKSAFNKFGLYNEDFKIGGDYEFFIRLFFKYNATYHTVNEFICYFVANGISNNPSYLDLNRAEAKKAWLLNVSERTYQLFEDYRQFENSSINWIYKKINTSKVYKNLFLLIHRFRNKLYRLIKK